MLSCKGVNVCGEERGGGRTELDTRQHVEVWKEM